jgi:hypothetical protein
LNILSAPVRQNVESWIMRMEWKHFMNGKKGANKNLTIEVGSVSNKNFNGKKSETIKHLAEAFEILFGF